MDNRILDMVSSPADLKLLTNEELSISAQEGARGDRDDGFSNRRSCWLVVRRGGDHPGLAQHAGLPARQDRVRRWAPGLCA